MSPIKIRHFIVPRILKSAIVAIVCLALVYYVLFQARFLIGGPQVALLDIPETIQSERQVVIKGTAFNITAIYLNGRPIVTNDKGFFSEKVVLENGYSIVRIDAADRYGRTTSIEKPFIYKANESLLN